MRCKNRSESKALKTALSHGLTGFVAIKLVAKSGEGLRECGHQCKPEPGRVLCWTRLRLWLRLVEPMERMGRPRDAPGFRQRPKRGQAIPACCILFSGANKRPRKMAPSHGFSGLGAIKPVANRAMFFGLPGGQAARVQSGFRVWALASAAGMSAGQAQRRRMERLRAAFVWPA